MQLYQLAIELDERSADVAERAVALGLGSVDPTSDLTQEQVDTLRAAYRKTAPEPDAERPVTVIGAAGAPTDPRPPKESSGRAKKVGIVVGCILALGAVVGFFASQASPAEERQKRLSEDLAAWQTAPPATVAPEVEQAALFPGDQPRDRAKLCAAAKTAADSDVAPAITNDQLDFADFRNWAVDREAWDTAIAQMIETGPTDAIPDITGYRDLRTRQLQIMSQASDADLRAWAQGVELHDLDGYGKAIDDARADMNAFITPICG